MKICPYCKAEIPEDATKCRYCGSSLIKLRTKLRTKLRPSFITVIIICAFFFFISLIGQSNRVDSILTDTILIAYPTAGDDFIRNEMSHLRSFIYDISKRKGLSAIETVKTFKALVRDGLTIEGAKAALPGTIDLATIINRKERD